MLQIGHVFRFPFPFFSEKIHFISTSSSLSWKLESSGCWFQCSEDVVFPKDSISPGQLEIGLTIIICILYKCRKQHCVISVALQIVGDVFCRFGSDVFFSFFSKRLTISKTVLYDANTRTDSLQRKFKSLSLSPTIFSC